MMLRHVSSPIKSARASGPMGWFMPSLMTESIASTSATPSIKANTASLIMGPRIRFETKPGKSLTSTGAFPSSAAKSKTDAVVSSLVASPRITSTNVITGTGFMKCMPMTRSGRAVSAAIAVIEMEDVLLARIASAEAIASSRRKRSYLISAFSGTASMINCEPAAAASRSAVGQIRSSASSRAAPSTIPFFTCRSRFLEIVAMARSNTSCDTSVIRTSRPPSAQTCAIPFPMVPPPTTVTIWMPMGSVLTCGGPKAP